VTNIKQAKEQHWKGSLEEIMGMELWVAHRYVLKPSGSWGQGEDPHATRSSKSGGATRSILSNHTHLTLCNCKLPILNPGPSSNLAHPQPGQHLGPNSFASGSCTLPLVAGHLTRQHMPTSDQQAETCCTNPGA